MNITTETQLGFDFSEAIHSPTSSISSFSEYSTTGSLSTISFYKPPTNISFHDKNGRVGTLNFDNGKMTFEGKADSSALILLGLVGQYGEARTCQLYLALETYKGLENNNGEKLADVEVSKGLWPEELKE